MHHRTLAGELLFRSGLLVLALAVVAVLGGILVGPAAATSQDMGARQAHLPPFPATGSPEPPAQTTQTAQADPTRDQPPLTLARKLAELRLEPGNAKGGAGTWQDYKATLRVLMRRYPWSWDVTGLTDFTIDDPDGSCEKAKGKVRCQATKMGPNTVTGILPPRAIPLVPFELKGRATLEVTQPPHHLRLDPNPKTIELGQEVAYKAFAEAEDNTPLGEVTGRTVFAIDQDGPCQGATCTPTKAGKHTVTGSLKDRPTVKGTATLEVTEPPKEPASTTTTATSGTTTTTTTAPASQPVISSVQPGFTFAGMSVEVGGNTGSCSRAGILTFHGNTGDVSVNVTADRQGNFVARVTIPKGTFPNAYQLELTVDCNGQLQRAHGDLSVLNIAPTAANDSARTIQDAPVSIRVTDNDRNPDPDTGYPTLVLVSSTPSHGTAEAQTDQSILYTPEQGFVGQDRFQYSLCDDILNAAGTAECSAATVTVTITDAQACLPSPGNISSIKVNPSKGPGGMTLGITATVDRKLAACPFRLLLGGTPLGPDVQVGPDGSITTERGVPKDAKPGPGTIRLATVGAQTLAETPFEIVPPGLSLLLKLLIGAGALVAGALARAVFRRWRAPQEKRARHEPDPPPEAIRAEPHTSPVEVTVEPNRDNTRTFTVRLEPHHDAGTQTLQEMTP